MTPFTSFKINSTINRLYEENLIPSDGLFNITETMLSKYVSFYNDTSMGNKSYDPVYARKIAGVMLLKLKLYRGGDFKSCKEGIVYAIKNPAWNNHVKVGITLDHKKRLSSYQTGDPFRSYYIDSYEFCIDRRETEKSIFNRFHLALEEGEWLRMEKSKEIMDFIREINGHVAQ